MTKKQMHPHIRMHLARCAVIAWALVAAPAMAQETLSLATLGVPLEQASDIKAQPLLLLSKFPSAGPALARYVAQALAKEPAAIDAVLSIIPDTSPEQASAIGAGMVRAIRALGGKSSDVMRQFTHKVMASDNKWLKTTFAAIGPYGGGALSVGGNRDAGVLERRTVADNAGGGGGAIGQSLAVEEGYVGPSVVNLPEINRGGVKARNTFAEPLNANITRYGMIVAITKSDAPSNGAVSTSPTI